MAVREAAVGLRITEGNTTRLVATVLLKAVGRLVPRGVETADGGGIGGEHTATAVAIGRAGRRGPAGWRNSPLVWLDTLGALAFFALDGRLGLVCYFPVGRPGGCGSLAVQPPRLLQVLFELLTKCRSSTAAMHRRGKWRGTSGGGRRTGRRWCSFRITRFILLKGWLLSAGAYGQILRCT